MRLLVFFFAFIVFAKSNAQQIAYPKKIIADLCSSEMYGRGYVNDGVNKAANYLEQEFKQLKLRKFENSYSQSYSFSVNTFPTNIYCSLDDVVKKAGVDFILDAGCKSIKGKFNCLHFNMKDSLDKNAIENTQNWCLIGPLKTFDSLSRKMATDDSIKTIPSLGDRKNFEDVSDFVRGTIIV